MNVRKTDMGRMKTKMTMMTIISVFKIVIHAPPSGHALISFRSIIYLS